MSEKTKKKRERFVLYLTTGSYQRLTVRVLLVLLLHVLAVTIQYSLLQWTLVGMVATTRRAAAAAITIIIIIRMKIHRQ